MKALCDVIPEKFHGSKCSKAGGSVEIHQLQERRVLLRLEQDSIFDILESILNTYTDSAFEDVDVVFGVYYKRLSSNSFAMAPQYLEESSKWPWFLPMFVALTIIVSVSIILILRDDDERRWKQVVGSENDNEKATSALFQKKFGNRSDMEFPIRPMETIEVGNTVYAGEMVYDYDEICAVSSINEEDEIKIQRNQLFREFNFPVVVMNDNVDL